MFREENGTIKGYIFKNANVSKRAFLTFHIWPQIKYYLHLVPLRVAHFLEGKQEIRFQDISSRKMAFSQEISYRKMAFSQEIPGFVRNSFISRYIQIKLHLQTNFWCPEVLIEINRSLYVYKRSPDVLKSWSPDVPMSRCPDVPMSRSPEVPKSRCPDVPMSWSPDVPMSWSPDVPMSFCPDVLMSWWAY